MVLHHWLYFPVKLKLKTVMSYAQYERRMMHEAQIVEVNFGMSDYTPKSWFEVHATVLGISDFYQTSLSSLS